MLYKRVNLKHTMRIFYPSPWNIAMYPYLCKLATLYRIATYNSNTSILNVPRKIEWIHKIKLNKPPSRKKSQKTPIKQYHLVRTKPAQIRTDNFHIKRIRLSEKQSRILRSDMTEKSGRTIWKRVFISWHIKKSSFGPDAISKHNMKRVAEQTAVGIVIRGLSV